MVHILTKFTALSTKTGYAFDGYRYEVDLNLKTLSKLVLIQILKEITKRGLVSKDDIQRL